MFSFQRIPVKTHVSVLGLCLFSLLAPNVSASAPEANDIERKQLTDIERYPISGSSHPVPQFSVDTSWPKMPSTWLIGQVPGLALDKSDNVWILHRPNSLSRIDLGLTNKSGLCCEAAPHVLQFSPDGDLLNAWGGPDKAPVIDGQNQWPQTVHGLYVDDQNTVWLGGNGKGDHVVLNFTQEGEFIRQFGRRGETHGNLSEDALGNPADIFHDTKSNRLLIADGYINKRITAFDTKEGDFDQLWGAYGQLPGGGTREGAFDVSQAMATAGQNSVTAENFGDIVHCVVQSDDGRIYVCDRKNNRLQVFKVNESGKAEYVRELVIAKETGGVGSATDVDFSPDNKYMYVADMMNGRIWVLWHDTYEVLGSFGRPGRYPGQFTWLHSVVVDSEGNLYTSEVNTGRRVQKFVLTGFTK
ncbi:hypothetical protein [Paraglaciecola sp. 2405UD69-4]|uniref:hypothetical protein n=1 Tax=Paraglaciecola sp. 2405UD69-4 TaxID=3391836 RepID=UPI0039C9DEFB